MSADKPVFVGVRPPAPPTHLGDGAYASFDGYQIWISANSHDSPCRVALDPGAFLSLLAYARNIDYP